MVFQRGSEIKPDFVPAVAIKNDFTKKATRKKEAKAIVFAVTSWLNDQYLVKDYSIERQTIQPHHPVSNSLLKHTEKDVSGPVNNGQDMELTSKEGQGWRYSLLLVVYSTFSFWIWIVSDSTKKKGGV